MTESERLRDKGSKSLLLQKWMIPLMVRLRTFRKRMVTSRAVRKVKQGLPETPEKCAEIIQKISASPKTRKHLV